MSGNLFFFFFSDHLFHWGIPGGLVVRDLSTSEGNTDLISGLERPSVEGNGNHSSILAWAIPWTKEPGRLQSIGSQRVRHSLMTEQANKWFYYLLIYIYADMAWVNREQISCIRLIPMKTSPGTLQCIIVGNFPFWLLSSVVLTSLNVSILSYLQHFVRR